VRHGLAGAAHATSGVITLKPASGEAADRGSGGVQRTLGADAFMIVAKADGAFCHRGSYREAVLSEAGNGQ
jgi:hypothetical protein